MQTIKSIPTVNTYVFIRPANILFILWGFLKRCPKRCLMESSWSSCHRRRKKTRIHEFKSWTRLFAFHGTLIPLERYESNFFSFQQRVICRADWALYIWSSNRSWRRKKILTQISCRPGGEWIPLGRAGLKTTCSQMGSASKGAPR